jgi:hypothetical protein
VKRANPRASPAAESPASQRPGRGGEVEGGGGARVAARPRHVCDTIIDVEGHRARLPRAAQRERARPMRVACCGGGGGWVARERGSASLHGEREGREEEEAEAERRCQHSVV